MDTISKMELNATAATAQFKISKLVSGIVITMIANVTSISIAENFLEMQKKISPKF